MLSYLKKKCPALSRTATQRLSFLLGHCPHWAYCPCWAYLVSNCQSGISRATKASWLAGLIRPVSGGGFGWGPLSGVRGQACQGLDEGPNAAPPHRPAPPTALPPEDPGEATRPLTSCRATRPMPHQRPPCGRPSQRISDQRISPQGRALPRKSRGLKREA